MKYLLYTSDVSKLPSWVSVSVDMREACWIRVGVLFRARGARNMSSIRSVKPVNFSSIRADIWCFSSDQFTLYISTAILHTTLNVLTVNGTSANLHEHKGDTPHSITKRDFSSVFCTLWNSFKCNAISLHHRHYTCIHIPNEQAWVFWLFTKDSWTNGPVASIKVRCYHTYMAKTNTIIFGGTYRR